MGAMRFRLSAVLVGVFIAATLAFAQAPRSPAAGGELGELIAEVRGLRADVNQVAGASIRMQVLVARVSLQEQRIATLGRQAAEVQAQLAVAMREALAVRERLQRLEAAAADGSTPANVRREVDSELEALKEDLESRQPREHQLRTQESELLSAIAAEHGRWLEFNNRLDELERSFPDR